MKIKFTSIKQAYNRHIRKGRKACAGFSGWERAVAICDYFNEAGHPHAEYTFNEMAMNRSSDHQFAIDLMKELANLLAINEHGTTFDSDEAYGTWHFECTIGGISFNGASVCRYSQAGIDDSHQLLVVEYGDEAHGFIEFSNLDECDKWIDRVMKTAGVQETEINKVWQIANRLDENWSSELAEDLML